MANDKKGQNKKTLPSLKELNKQQSAGFAFSASTLVSLLFSFVFLAILSAGGYVIGEEKPDWYLYFGFLLPQLAFAFVAVVCFVRVRVPVKEVVGKPSIKYFLLAIALQFGLMSLSQLNTWFVDVLEGAGYNPSPVQIPSTQGFGVVGVLFVVALLPAVLEELIFRGFLMRGLKGLGFAASVLLCGALFSLYHQNPVQTLYQFCCGVVFAIVAFRAGSILPTMLAHFINNAFIVLYYHFTGQDAFAMPLWLTIVTAVTLVATIAYLLFFDKKTEGENKEESRDVKGFFAFVSIGVIVCLVNWIGALF